MNTTPVLPKNEVVSSGDGKEVGHDLPFALPRRNFGRNVSLHHGDGVSEKWV